MSSPRVLVVTADLDPTADHVVRHLLEQGVEFARLDGAHFPQHATLTTTLGVTTTSGWSGTLCGLRQVDLAQLRSVYWRRPRDVAPSDTLSPSQRQWSQRQARHALWGLVRALGIRMVNDPAAVEAAESKPVNLAVAQACGLTVPPTLITNDPAQVAAFGRTYGPIVYKPLDGRGPRDEHNRPTGAVYVTEVPSERWDDPGIATTAHCFQQRIVDKAHDLRVTVVGEHAFAVEIHARHEAGRLDWRRTYQDLDYQIRPLPCAESEAVARLLTRLGLCFATLDFVVDQAGRHLLVDVNPNGQWAWLEYATGVPISQAMADLLTQESP